MNYRGVILAKNPTNTVSEDEYEDEEKEDDTQS